MSGVIKDGPHDVLSGRALVLVTLRSLDNYDMPALMRGYIETELDTSLTSEILNSLILMSDSPSFTPINKVEIDEQYFSRYGVVKQYRNHEAFCAGYDAGEMGGGRVVDAPGLIQDLT